MICSILITAALASLSHQFSLPYQAIPHHSINEKLPILKFRSDGTFKVTVFSDLHLGESPKTARGLKQDRKTLQVMGSVLDRENPDFVVLNGDLITGEVTSKENGPGYVDQIVKPLVERNLSWGSAYGNHDHTFQLGSEKIFNREHKFRGARTQKMVRHKRSGTSNYYLPVYSEECKDADPALYQTCHPELLLWFFDSRGGGYYHERAPYGLPRPQPNWVDKSVVKWFYKTNQKLVKSAKRTIPSLAFVHIPINATDYEQKHFDPNRSPGINDENGVSQQAQYWCNETYRDWGNNDCRYSGLDVPFMAAMAATPGIIGLFHGHDHGNTWCRRWDSQIPGTSIHGNGLNLCFGQHTGYGGYGEWIRGGRQIQVTREKLENLTVETYIRLENGKTVGAVVLNSTYNQDWYPATPNDKTTL
ncbi:hypothetical protein QQS21_007560 [Conoideocrella luteorostrata]|uniref:Calcineurin-like phosphoesterase domain-containing protein n=1 Tax=Conoideocrella luteorostrata TaxID=1105319 RepID=A0AAJ0CKF2_9HYPO|nr:hypothetical protein QQS21_007560 [Conoideocrella luteorostrata]